MCRYENWDYFYENPGTKMWDDIKMILEKKLPVLITCFQIVFLYAYSNDSGGRTLRLIVLVLPLELAIFRSRARWVLEGCLRIRMKHHLKSIPDVCSDHLVINFGKSSSRFLEVSHFLRFPRPDDPNRRVHGSAAAIGILPGNSTKLYYIEVLPKPNLPNLRTSVRFAHLGPVQLSRGRTWRRC